MELMRALVLTAAAVLVVAGFAFPAAGSVGAPTPGAAITAADTVTDTQSLATAVPGSANNSSSNASAGSRLSGAFATQQADLSGELETGAVTVRLTRANTTTERVAELARLETGVETRLQRLDRRRERLRTALDTGALTPGEYAYRLAQLRADAAAAESIADQGGRAAAALPESVATEYGVGPASFQALEHRSRNYSDHLAGAFGNESAALFGWNPFADESTVGQFAGTDADSRSFADGEGDFDGRVNESELGDLLNGTDAAIDGTIDGLTGTNDTSNLVDPNETTDGSDGSDGTDVFGDGLTDDDSDSLLDGDEESAGDSTPTATDDGWTSGDDGQTTESDTTTVPSDGGDGGLFDG